MDYEQEYHEERKARYAAQGELVVSQAYLSEAVKVLEYYSGIYEPALTRPNEGPWGVNSDDFGQKAREFLATLGEENGEAR